MKKECERAGMLSNVEVIAEVIPGLSVCTGAGK